MARRIVPVVYGAADYARLAPPHSFINAMDFSSPRQLADYLLELDRNDTLYGEYFWWKDHYTVESGLGQMSRHGFCDLCAKLHQDDNVKSYPNLVHDWHVDAQCKKVEPFIKENT